MSFQKILQGKKIDLALFINPSSSGHSHELVYFCQYDGCGALLVPRSAKPLLIVPKMFEEQAQKGIVKNIRVLDKKKLFESIKETIKKQGIPARTIGICFQTFTHSLYTAFKKEFRKAKIVDITNDFLQYRAVKSPKEIAVIKKGFSIANSVFEKTMKNFSDFRTESDVAAFMLYESKKQGCEVSFPTIIASGKNASIPHYFEAQSKLNSGLCVIDFGIRFKGYNTDMTRTIGIKKVTEHERQKYNMLLKIQKKLIGQARIGIKCADLYNSCLALLKTDAKYFTHGLGHGIGVQLHELPNLSSSSKEILKNNMVFTIEPGIYLPKKMGIRIEDSIIIQKKPIILTKPTKELRIL
jgi:Xaa-Pro aminopeptidase